MSSKNDKISRRRFLAESCEIAGSGVLGLAVSPVLLKSNIARAASPYKRIKIGQVGTAHPHARGKMETLRKLRDLYEVVGIVESDPERRRAVQNRPTYKGVEWMSEEQLLNTKGLKAVAVETALRNLVPAATRCLEAGMHLHLDKPPGESLSAFEKLLSEAARRKLAVQLGYMFRYNPAFQFCFKAVREGWLGDIFEVHGVISKKISVSSRKSWLEYTGGTMENLGCHLIDALVTVLGKPEKIAAYVRHTRPEQDNLKDNQLAVFEYPKATATIRSSVVEVEGGKRRQFVVCGDQGTVDIRPLEPPRLLLALSRPSRRGKYKKGYQEVKLPPMAGRYDDQLIEFARIIRGETESDYTPTHDLVAHEAMLLACGLTIN